MMQPATQTAFQLTPVDLPVPQASEREPTQNVWEGECTCPDFCERDHQFD